MDRSSIGGMARRFFMSLRALALRACIDGGMVAESSEDARLLDESTDNWCKYRNPKDPV